MSSLQAQLPSLAHKLANRQGREHRYVCWCYLLTVVPGAQESNPENSFDPVEKDLLLARHRNLVVGDCISNQEESDQDRETVPPQSYAFA